MKWGVDTPNAVAKGRLELATYLVQGIMKGQGHRDRVDLSKVFIVLSLDNNLFYNQYQVVKFTLIGHHPICEFLHRSETKITQPGANESSH